MMPYYIQLTSPLTLCGNPTLSDHATTKQYVDSLLSSVDASWFTSGVLPATVIPSMTGEVSLTNGSSVAVLSATGVVSGSYCKVTTNGGGRIASGGYLTVADVPNFSWSKITSGKPSTASGYGITNLIALSGGTASGGIITTGIPSSALHAVTKGYVDTAFATSIVGGISVGDIIRKPVGVTPSGFLRCNGGLVSTTTYSALFNVLGYGLYFTVSLDYTSYGVIGGGQPWRKQYDINTTQSGDITGWSLGTALPATVMGSQIVVTKSMVYLLGGVVGGVQSATVYVAAINSDGTLGTWTVGTSLPATVTYSQPLVTKNRVYLLGGSVNGVSSSAVYTAVINNDGTLGVWGAGTALPATMYQSQSIVTKNRVYLLGGSVNGVISAKVYTAPINSDGTLGVWAAGTALPSALTYCQPLVTKNVAYLIGGYTGSAYSSAVYTTVVNSDGTLGVWTSYTALPASIYGSQAVITKNKIYLLGGYINGTYSSAVYSATIGSDGSLGVWSAGTALPVTVAYSQFLVTSSKVYIVGGFFNSAQSNKVYVANITGGLNDYSYLYDGSVNKFDGSNIGGTVLIGSQTGGTGGGSLFSIPDFSTAESNGINYYIKT